MAKRRSANNGAWIIAGAVVLVGLLIVIALVLVLGKSGNEQAASPSASVTSPRPTRTHSPHARPSSTESVSPSPSPSPRHSHSPSPSPSPSPIDEQALVREAVAKQAALDRPGQVRVITEVSFYTDRAGCPQTGQASATTVRFTTPPKVGIYIFCRARTHWEYADGPLYGE